jgi:transcriptional regulator with XRE-family HTH domain
MERRRKAQVSARDRFAIRLKAQRLERGLSQEDLADLAGLHRTYIGSVERAERNISIDSMERLSAALRLDITDLLAPL